MLATDMCLRERGLTHTHTHTQSIDRSVNQPINRPLLRSENPQRQALAAQLFEQLHVQYPMTYEGKVLPVFLQGSKDRQAMLAKFGRFPARNEVMGRNHTPEEAVLLKNVRLRRSRNGVGELIVGQMKYVFYHFTFNNLILIATIKAAGCKLMKAPKKIRTQFQAMNFDFDWID